MNKKRRLGGKGIALSKKIRQKSRKTGQRTRFIGQENILLEDKMEKMIQKEAKKKQQDLSTLKKQIKKILQRHNITRAGIFGSCARGEAKKSSDIDIVIKPIRKMGFKFAGLEMELSEKLKRKIDLVSYNGLSPYLKDRILSQEVRII